MDTQLRRARERQRELEHLLQDPSIAHDRNRIAQLSKELADLHNALHYADELAQLTTTAAATRELAAASFDTELRSLAEKELTELDAKSNSLRAKILEIIDPPDPRDRKDIIIEIRSGAGGDEASLFAAQLFRMYVRYAERRGWSIQLVSESRTSVGGYKEVVFELRNGPAFRDLKYESGVHRVQRVPATEKSGRVHTSTVTVVVLPEADEVDVALDPKDLEITATTSRGHGGQSVNTTYSAIRVRHKPSGIIVSCQDERSQLQNREKALRILRARLLDAQEQHRQREASLTRKSLIGSGDRSEKIRTYNIPQDRITDHRMKKSFYGITNILNGNLDSIITELRSAELTERSHTKQP